jgi:uncharacterized RDD family membrane protein YckC
MGPSPEAVATEPVRAVGKTWAFRRFAARAIDLLLVWNIVLPLAILLAPGFLKQNPAIHSIAIAAIWLFVEPVLMSTWQTTPGKWMLNYRVQTMSGGPLSFGAAFDRAFSVYTWGIGCMVPGVSLVCMFIAYLNLSSAGATRWDRGRFLLAHKNLGAGRIIAAVALTIGLVIGAALWDVLRIIYF